MSNYVSADLMEEIVTELSKGFPKGISFNGKTKQDAFYSFEFQADDRKATINYDEASCTFVPLNSDDPNIYSFKVDLKNMIFNKEGYLLVIQDYLIAMMKLESHYHYGYNFKGFRFGGSQVYFVYNFTSDPDIVVEISNVERMEEVTDKSQKDAILALKRLFEASLVRSAKLVTDDGAFVNYAAPLWSQQITYEISKRAGEISDMPLDRWSDKSPNPLFNSEKAVAIAIVEFSAKIQKALKNKMQTFID